MSTARRWSSAAPASRCSAMTSTRSTSRAASTNFHCYGLAMENMTGRRYWNAEQGEWLVFADSSSIVEARPGYPSTAAA